MIVPILTGGSIDSAVPLIAGPVGFGHWKFEFWNLPALFDKSKI